MIRSTTVALAGLCLLGPAAAQAAPPELATSNRLQDRRYVAAADAGADPGLRGRPLLRQRLAHHRRDGRHLHAAAQAARLGLVRRRRPMGRPGHEVHERRGLHALRPAVDRRASRLQRTDFAPDGRRGALFGLKLTNPGASAHRDGQGRRPLRAAARSTRGASTAHRPNAERQRARHRRLRRQGRSCSATQAAHGRGVHHDYTAIVGSDRDAGRRRDGPGPLRPVGAGRVCPGDSRRRCRRDCDDGPFGKGTGGQLRYKIKLPANGSRTLWVAVAGSDDSPADARAELAAALTNPAAALARKSTRAASWRAGRKLVAARRPAARRTRSSGASRTSPTSRRSRRTSRSAGPTRARSGRPRAPWPRCRWIGAGFPDYPWLFATDGEYTAFASVALGQFEPIKDHMRALRDISDVAQRPLGRGRARGGRPTAPIWFGKDHATPTARRTTSTRTRWSSSRARSR